MAVDDNFEFDALLSHSVADKTIVHDLLARLRRHGLRFWIDDEQIKVGDSILDKIDDGLTRSRTVLFFISARSVTDSEWVKTEVNAARFPDPSNRTRRLIPVRLDDTELPPTLRSLRHVDWREQSEGEFNALVDVLKSGPPRASVFPRGSSKPPVPAMLRPERRLPVFVGLCAAMSLLAFCGAFIARGLGAVLLPLPLLAIILYFKNRLLARHARHSTNALASLFVIHAASAFYLIPGGTWRTYAPAIADALHVPFIPNGIVPNGLLAVGVALVVTALNALWFQRAISLPVQGTDAVWPELSRHEFDASLTRYCKALIAALERYDTEVNWSDQELTPLEAEVEVERRMRVRPRVARDLVEAIRTDSGSTVFIVLGDPGSGKSVSLRRLVRDLCAQAPSTGVVPVYVNLREYPPGEALTLDSLVAFIRDRAFEQTGRDGRAFLDKWYEPFRQAGRLFLVIDSFDELPMVLDSDDRSDSHRQVSLIFDRLFTQETQGCRTVLASRHFRAPVGVKGTRLIVRPFSERQIRRAMRTWLEGTGIDTDAFVLNLFRRRANLVPALRNPFTAELIAEHARRHGATELPTSLFGIFDNYLSTRFEGDLSALGAHQLSAAELRQASSTIALGMYYAGDVGLEAPVDRVAGFLTGPEGAKATDVVKALRYTRIARVGGHKSERFSFVHRRFAEFFVVEGLRAEASEIPFDSIPSDSRWRDCLVMFCGVAPISMKQKIANYCWSVIDDRRHAVAQGEITEARDAIHCCRFLADAFRSDPDAIAHFCEPLSDLVVELIRSPDLLVAKIGAEMIPLIGPAHQNRAVSLAFRRPSAWIWDTTLGSCRHLAQVDWETHQAIRRHLDQLSSIALLERFEDLRFTLSLSDAFRGQRRMLNMDVAELGSLAFASVAMAIIGLVVWPERLLTVLALSAVLPMQDALHSRIFLRGGGRSALPLGRDGAALLGMLFVGGSIAVPLVGDRAIAHSLWLIGPALVVWPLAWLAARFVARPAELRTPARLRRWAKYLFYGAATILSLWLLYRLWIALPEYIRTLAGYAGLAVFGLLIALGFCVAIPDIVRDGQALVREMIERRRLGRIAWPQVTSTAAVYATTLSFRSPAVRAGYLEGIRLRRISIEGRVTEPPSDLLTDSRVEEEVARLREQWYEVAG
jgi:hypothetical protein